MLILDLCEKYENGKFNVHLYMYIVQRIYALRLIIPLMRLAFTICRQFLCLIFWWSGIVVGFNNFHLATAIGFKDKKLFFFRINVKLFEINAERQGNQFNKLQLITGALEVSQPAKLPVNHYMNLFLKHL